MDASEEKQELAYYDYMGARDAALQAAAGYFVVSNVPSDILHIIASSTTDNNIRLAAQTVLWQRGEEWEVEV